MLDDDQGKGIHSGECVVIVENTAVLQQPGLLRYISRAFGGMQETVHLQVQSRLDEVNHGAVRTSRLRDLFALLRLLLSLRSLSLLFDAVELARGCCLCHHEMQSLCLRPYATCPGACWGFWRAVLLEKLQPASLRLAHAVRFDVDGCRYLSLPKDPASEAETALKVQLSTAAKSSEGNMQGFGFVWIGRITDTALED